MHAQADSGDPAAGRRLALIGLPAALAEPVTILADIMGWQAVCLPAGPVMRPAARLCLALLPGGGSPPLAAWSPDAKLNEHISRSGLSILDQPPCLSRLELLLGLAATQPLDGGVADDAFQGVGPNGTAGGHCADGAGPVPADGGRR